MDDCTKRDTFFWLPAAEFLLSSLASHSCTATRRSSSAANDEHLEFGYKQDISGGNTCITTKKSASLFLFVFKPLQGFGTLFCLSLSPFKGLALYIIIGLSLLLLLFLLWKETSRKNKARLLWRLVATMFAIASLACMALPVSYCVKEKIDTNNQFAVLLTEGADGDSLNKFFSISNNAIPVLTTGENLKASKKYNAVYVADVCLLSQQYKDIHTFHVFGYGLQKEQLDSLKDAHLIFHPATLSAGITSIHWPQVIKTGQKLFIQGSFNNPSAYKAKMVLRSFNTTLDSVSIAFGKNEKFQLTTIPKQAGRAVYSIAVIINKDTVEKESAPIQVEKGASLKVLILASSPGFENRFLKNYLSQNGSEVVVRTAISKNKYDKEYLNTAQVNADRITAALLDKFDITIADATELAAISKAELAAIQTQVAQKSMGLIIKADSLVSNSPFYAGRFPLTFLAGNTKQQVVVNLSDSTGNLPALPIENLLFIRHRGSTQPLVSDKQNRIFVNNALYGTGKIIVTTLTNTYNWALSGNQNEYDKFWTTLLNKAAAKPATDEAWFISPSPARINEAVQLQVETNNAGVPKGLVAESDVYLKSNDDLPYQWTGTFYPAKEGWQPGIGLNGKAFYWYAYNKNDWKNIDALKKIKATEQYVAENLHASKKESKAAKPVEREIPKLLFFFLFLLSAGFLWFEDKI